jgi:hypothetical protein
MAKVQLNQQFGLLGAKTRRSQNGGLVIASQDPFLNTLCAHSLTRAMHAKYNGGLALNFMPATTMYSRNKIMHKQFQWQKFTLDVRYTNMYKKRVFQIRNSTSGSKLLHRRQNQKRLTLGTMGCGI